MSLCCSQNPEDRFSRVEAHLIRSALLLEPGIAKRKSKIQHEICLLTILLTTAIELKYILYSEKQLKDI